MHRRTLLKAGLVAPAAAALTPLVGTATATAAPRIAETLATGLDTPWNIAFLPNGDALVSERDTGWVTRVFRTGGLHRIGRLPGVQSGGESGLMGLALHPGFSDNRLVYAFHSTATDNRVVRFSYVDGALGSPHPVLTGLPTNDHHNGGGLLFGPAGFLYVSVGDAGHPHLAQDRRFRAGKILRIHPDTGAAVKGNPFGNRVWTWGHRNPEGITFAPDGSLWSSEFGQDTWDELNHVMKGHNYGWPRQEGTDGRGGFTDPLAQWHPQNCSPSGIAITQGRAWLGALRGQCLWSVQLTGANRGARTRYFQGELGRIRAVAKAPDGSLWIGTSNQDGRGSPAATDDRILRVVV